MVSIITERKHHGVIHGFLAHAADAGVRQPDQRMPPVNNLE
ncbi:MAG: hypothetical protein WCS42_10125 [Verrucomicrobiota bacterium]